MDLATVLKVSQAVSGEIVLEKLIDTLLRTAIEHSGAERGLLILPRGAELRIQTEATTVGNSVTVGLRDVPISSAELPEPVVQCAVRTKESVILDDASARGSFSDGEYVRREHARSILCLPLVTDGKLIAVLYLENNLAANVFTPARIAVLNVLASAATISLENSRLYREIQEREAKIRRLVDANIVGIFIWDLEGRILEANDAFLRMVGYERDDLVSGRIRWTDLTPPEWLDQDERRWVPELKMTGSLRPFEKEYFRKDGSRVPVLIGAASFDDSAKEGVAFVLDLTEHKRAEEELRTSEARFRTFVEFAADAFMLHRGEDGMVLDVNQQACDNLGYTREELIGMTPTDFDAVVDPASLDTIMKRLDAGEVFGFETLHRRKDGTVFPVEVRVRPFRHGGRCFNVSLTRDITERKRLEEQLREAQKMEAMGRLAGGIAHDFNNLMTVITGYSDLLHAALVNDLPLQEKVDEIHKAGEQAALLTRQLLAFSRRQAVQPKVLDLNDVLGQMANMLCRVLSEDIALKILPEAEACPIRCDPGQIQQVVMNLAINARDAMPEGGELLLSTENVTIDETGAQAAGVSSGAYVRLSVSDTGFGMDSETKAHIFEPFFTTKQAGKGTGLGLATVHGIVQQAGGWVTAESEVGKGTTFRLYFPRAKQPVEISNLRTHKPPAASLHGCETILLVEDQAGLRKLLTEILERHGYRVLPAADGREALRVLHTRPEKIDLIVTDVVMPQIGGRELIEQLPLKHSETKVLFMSGYADKSWQLDESRVQHAFIDKPFHPEAVLRKVREILDQGAESCRSA